MKKQEKLKIVSIIIVLGLLLAGIFSYLIVNEEKEITNHESSSKIIDDRISPYTEQALFIEIKRIRAKGVIEQITDTGPLVQRVNDWELNEKGFEFPLISRIADMPISGPAITYLIRSRLPGRGWDKKPNFYYGVELDGYDWDSDRRKFSTWDTGYIFDEFYRVVEQEQEESDVEIRVFETGDNEPVESFKVIYDYRLGTWEGDDYFKDSDGYGHYNGSEYEVWFDIRQTDSDRDQIPYWTEINILGTNPDFDDRRSDHDGDNCSTAWEWKWGYDPFEWNDHNNLDPDEDGIENTEEEYMSEWLANPYQPEIYMEVDFSKDAPDQRPLGFMPWKLERKPGKILPRIEKVLYTGQEVVLFEESKAMLMERYNEHGITLHIDDGCMRTHINSGGETLDLLAPDVGIKPYDYVISGYYKKNFPDERKGIFRYCVLVVLAGGYNYNMDYSGHYDTVVVSASDIFFDPAKSPRAQRLVQAISLLHELGHSCGFGYLHCGGVDNNTIQGSVEHWYDYKSVMNYYWYGLGYLDYSDGTHGENDCDDWGKIDLGYFQRAPGRYDLEGIDFDYAEPPINRR